MTHPAASLGMKLHIVMPSGRRHGGAEEALLQVIATWAATSTQPMRITFLEDGEMPELCRERGAVVDVLPSGRLRQFARLGGCVAALRSRFLREQPDLVLAWMTKAHIYAGSAAWLARVPAAYFQHGHPDGGRVDRLARLIPAVGGLTCSEFVAKEQRMIVNHPVLPVLPSAAGNFFISSQEKTSSTLRAELGIPEDGVVLGTVGRLQRWKGMHHFVTAAESLISQKNNIYAVIIGGPHHLEPDYAVALEKQVRASPAAKRIRLAGPRADIADCMRAMDIFVHTSEREPFGIVVAEAMALGLPVIATKPGGPEEMIVDETDGILVESGDVKALARAMQRFVTDRNFARFCGLNAAKAAKQFLPAAFGIRFASALNDLVRPHHSGGEKPAPV